MGNETEIIQTIRRVLAQAAKGKGQYPQYMTAYQILDRFPMAMRTTLIEQYGKSGAEVGNWSSAAKHIANLLKGMGGIEVSYFDTRGVNFRIGGEERRAGYKVCGLYRISRP
jgi:hypothetical protein